MTYANPIGIFLVGVGFIILLGLIAIAFIWWLESDAIWDEFQSLIKRQ